MWGDRQKMINSKIWGSYEKKMIPSGLSRTWSYSEFLEDGDIEYAQLYCAGKSLSDVCPEHLWDRWDRVRSRLRAHYRSLSISKIKQEFEGRAHLQMVDARPTPFSGSCLSCERRVFLRL